MRVFVLAVSAAAMLQAQVVGVRPAGRMSLPAPTIDGNSPGFWQDGAFRVYTSTGNQMAMAGADLIDLALDAPPQFDGGVHSPLWIEAVWADNDGTVYAWYHHEPGGLCGGKLTAPEIGALVSTDGGHTFSDLGIVLASGDPLNCGAQNGFFAGGHGDFSVILDQQGEYFYFLFTNYGGPAQSQGVAVARMAFADRANPAGSVYKYHLGGWEEPGLGGMVTPIFPAAVAWDRSNTNSLWGPAVHWNTYLNQYVVLLNHACCQPKWPQEGIYIAFNADLSNPGGWAAPAKIMDSKQIGFAPGYYPEVFGTAPGESDTLAGQVARLFIKGVSQWEIVFAQ